MPKRTLSLEHRAKLAERAREVYGTPEGRAKQAARAQKAQRCTEVRAKIVLTWHKYAVDHDHTNGRVRGVLCSGCNRGTLPIVERWGTAVSKYLRDAA